MIRRRPAADAWPPVGYHARMHRSNLALLLLTALLTAACAGDDRDADGAGGAPGVDAGPPAPQEDAGLGPATPDGFNPLAPRVPNTTCTLPDAPPLGTLDLAPAHPNRVLSRPVWYGAVPGRPDMRAVVEQDGRILLFPATGDAPNRTFWQRGVSRAGNEEGLLGLAFHPRYAENGKLYVYYSAADPRRSIISELQVDPADADRVRPDSERVLMEIPQPFSNHNGGDLRFGPDGYLYVSLGDGGAGGDPHGHGQRPDTVLAAILRIDVNTQDAVCGLPYGIPADNPFAEGRCQPGVEAEGQPEVWAWGLRNPWRMSFDRSTGELWVADVGQDAWEEIDVVEGGQNYGWNAVEGERCYTAGCDPSRYAAPVYAYGRAEGRSITGGFVYRGPSLPELWGAYVFGDYASGNIWALRRRPGAPAEVTLLADTNRAISAFGEGPDGELFVVSFNGGVERFVRRADAGPVEPVPARLSETGCFTDVASHTLAPGVVPYGVQARLWSDGAEKLRAFALPAGEVIEYRDEDAWGFPDGTVFIKSFRLADRLIETRLYRRGRNGWNGYSYRWTEDQTDAELLDGPLDARVPGPDGVQTWHYPSRAECDQCPTDASGVILGLTTRQLNGLYETPDGRPYGQLAALAGAGYVNLPGPPETLPAFPAPEDPDADLGGRVRALLDANCAMCHRPDGTANARIDLRATTPLADTGLCDVAPQQGDLGLADARLVAPGDPARSVLLARMNRRGADQMPPLGSNRIDPHGTTLVGAWIQSLVGCP